METNAAVPAALPNDVLAAILGRLLARSLATSRCVCKAWRDLVDKRGLLQRIQHLLPHTVTGMFVNYVDHGKAHFFARPTPAAASPTVDGNFDYVVPECRRYSPYKVADHCNGLVLYMSEDYGELYVCNPTTRRWVRLPELAAVGAVSDRRAFLAFSPAVSRHYQVLVAPLDLVPLERQRPMEKQRRRRQDPLQDAHPAGDTEWPPSRWTWHVFSSRSGRWRERVFVRQGEAAGVVADLQMDSMCYAIIPRWRYGVYRRGALYVHCRGEYVSRLSLSNGDLSLSNGDYSYRVIKLPIDRSGYYIHPHEWGRNVLSYLGRSNGEVYFVAINMCRLRVWMLNDQDSQQHDTTARSEWILKHDGVLRPDAWLDLGPGRWIMDDYNQRRKRMMRGFQIWDDYYNQRKERGKLDWSSDGDDDKDDIICSIADGEEDNDNVLCPETFHFLGFHPYKAVIFLAHHYAVVAYHLSTSKAQYLGEFRPADHNYGLYDSFVYTPCSDLRHRG